MSDKVTYWWNLLTDGASVPYSKLGFQTSRLLFWFGEFYISQCRLLVVMNRYGGGGGVMFDKLTLLPWLLLLIPWQLYRGLFPMIGLICLCLFLPPLHPHKVLAVAQIPREQILCHTLDASLVVVGLLKVLPIFINIVLEYCRVAIMLGWSRRNWLEIDYLSWVQVTRSHVQPSIGLAWMQDKCVLNGDKVIEFDSSNSWVSGEKMWSKIPAIFTNASKVQYIQCRVDTIIKQ